MTAAWRPWRTVALLAAGTAMLAGATIDYDTPPGGQGCLEVVSGLAEMSAVETTIDPAMSGQLPQHHVALHLRHAGLAGQRQALTTVLGCWWLRPPGALDGTVLTRAAELPSQGLDVHWVSSSLTHRPDLEAPVHQLLQPWLGTHGGIGYEADRGTWPATLDPAGAAHLVQVLGLLEHHQACCPDLVPDPLAPDPGHALAGPVGGGTWDALAGSLATAADVSVAVGPGLPPDAPAPAHVPGATLGAVIAALQANACQVTVRHGVVGLDQHPVPEGEHPAQRRLLALIPVGEVVSDEADGTLLVQQLVRLVDPTAWAQPGAGLHFIAPDRALLAAGDAATLHHVLDAIDVLDTLGLEDGLRTLAAHAPAGGAGP